MFPKNTFKILGGDNFALQLTPVKLHQSVSELNFETISFTEKQYHHLANYSILAQQHHCIALRFGDFHNIAISTLDDCLCTAFHSDWI